MPEDTHMDNLEEQRKKHFDHDIDLDRLREETGLSVEQIAALVGLKNPKAVYPWARPADAGGTRPSYNALARLISAGASVSTLFGVYAEDGGPYVPSCCDRGGRKCIPSESDLRPIVLKVLEDLGFGSSRP